MKTHWGTLMLITLGLFISPQSPAQYSIELQTTFTNLRIALLSGQKIALRDLGSLLDEDQVIEIQLGGQSLHNRVGSIALLLLKDFTLFTPKDILLGEQTKSLEFLEFYYKHEEQIFFSELTKTFQVQAIEDVSPAYRLVKYQPPVFRDQPDALFRMFAGQIRGDIALNYYDQIPAYLNQIAQLKTRQAHRYLLDCLEGKHWGQGRNPLQAKVYRSIILGLRHYPDMESAQALMSFLKDDTQSVLISPDLISFSMSLITNIHPAYPRAYTGDLQAFYQEIFSKYPDFEQLKALGYQETFDYSLANFEDSVDYYGKMLNDSYRLFWIKKYATKDIIQTKHPKSLLYLAAQIFQNRNETHEIWYQDLNLVEQIRELTQVEVEVQNTLGQWVRNPESDPLSLINYLRYWMQHYHDYTWNDEFQVFENQADTIFSPPDFSKLLKKLYISSESESLKTFEQIAQLAQKDFQTISFPPPFVVRLGNRRNLPAYPFQTLKVLNTWINFCRENQIQYQLDQELTAQTNRLRQNLSEETRFQLENQIITNIKLEQIDALEYQAILTQNQIWYLNTSLSRIIQKAYQKHWQALFAQPKYLRAYLKKSFLFHELPIQGACKKYLDRLEYLSESDRQKIEIIFDQEEDPEIKMQCAKALQKPLLSPDFELNQIEDQQIKSSVDFQRICDKILTLRDIDKIKSLFRLLADHQSVNMVPALVKLLDQSQVIESKQIGQRVLNYTIGDYAVFLLEKIYKHSFVDEKDFYQHKSQDIFLFRKSTKDWKVKWQNQKNAYQIWEKQFFDQKITQLKNAETVSLNLMNNISSSPFYQKEEHLQTILKALHRLRPMSDLKFLFLNHKIKWTDIQGFMKNIGQPEGLNRLLSYVKNTPEEIREILTLIAVKTRLWGNYQVGKLYFDLFYQANLRSWLKAEPDVIAPASITQKLQTFGWNLNPGQIEYYLYKRMKFALSHITRTLSEQVKAARQLKDKDEQSEALEDILLHIDFQSLGELLQNRQAYEQGPYPEILSGYLQRFIREDLGIPKNMGTASNLNRLQQYHRKYDERDFYLQYLTDFYPNILNADSSLSMTLVHEALSFDLIEDFAGITTGYRYWPVLALLKVLEIDFNTRLGFQHNFLHPIGFYEKEDITLRVIAWQKFLGNRHNVLEE